jgi:hypothetical protein
MVNMDVVQDRLLKGAFVGLGSFAGSLVEPVIEDNLPGGSMATTVAQGALGAGLSIGVDQVFDNPRSLPNDAVEFVGYGMQGNAWSNLAETVQTGQLAGSQTVRVSSDGGTSQTGQTVQVRERDRQASQASGAGSFQAEVA